MIMIINSYNDNQFNHNHNHIHDFYFKAKLPDKPTNLQVTHITSRSAEITWQAPQNEGDGGLDRFRIKLKKDNSLTWSNSTGNVTTYKLDKPTPYSTYKISVAAGNK